MTDQELAEKKQRELVEKKKRAHEVHALLVKTLHNEEISAGLSADEQKRLDHLKERATDLKGNLATYVPIEKVLDWADEHQDHALAKLVRSMQGFDHLAMSLQADHFWKLTIVSGSAALFLLAFELFAHAPGFRHMPVMFIGIVFLVLGTFTIFALRARDSQINYLRMRAVAEGLRIAVFWRSGRIDPDLTKLISVRYRPRLTMVKKLIDQCLRDAGVQLAGSRLPDKLVWDEWFVDQVNYFGTAHRKNHSLAEFWKRISLFCFALGVTGILGLLIFMFNPEPLNPESNAFHQVFNHHWHWVFEIYMTISPMLIVLAAIAEFYFEKRGFEANASRFEYAEHIFLRAADESTQQEHVKRVSEHETETQRRFVAPLILISIAVLILLFTPVAYLLHLDAGSCSKCSFTLASIFAGAALVMEFVRMKRRMSVAAAKVPEERPTVLATMLGEEAAVTPHLTESRLKEVGEEAFDECIDWYVASIDREITLPKG